MTKNRVFNAVFHTLFWTVLQTVVIDRRAVRGNYYDQAPFKALNIFTATDAPECITTVVKKATFPRRCRNC